MFLFLFSAVEKYVDHRVYFVFKGFINSCKSVWLGAFYCVCVCVCVCGGGFLNSIL